MYNLKLGDGTELRNLELCGLNEGVSPEFRSKEEIHDPYFTAARLRGVTIECEDPLTEGAYLLGYHEVLRCSGVREDPLDGCYYIGLEEYAPEVIEQEKVKGDIAYMAMMMGVEL